MSFNIETGITLTHKVHIFNASIGILTKYYQVIDIKQMGAPCLEKGSTATQTHKTSPGR